MLKFTVKDFHKKYPNDDVCLQEIFNQRYGNTKECPHCNKTFKYYRVTKRKCYSCSYCGHQIYPLANTIFHRSTTSLKDWFHAMFLFSTSKNGVSGKELERQLGVTYKCAWRIAKQIRLLFATQYMLTGIVESDETYYGGKESNKHKSKKTKNNQGRSVKTKTPIMGAVERDGNIVATVVGNTESSTVQRFIRDNIKIGSEIHTDEYQAYNKLPSMGYKHEKVYHNQKEYVRDRVYTNTIEGFWSQLKRSIHGTYHKVSKKYLQQYVNEFTYRYNLRKSETPIFFNMIKRISR